MKLGKPCVHIGYIRAASLVEIPWLPEVRLTTSVPAVYYNGVSEWSWGLRGRNTAKGTIREEGEESTIAEWSEKEM